MSREIKFRGQRVDNKEWIFGYYFFNGNEYGIITNIGFTGNWVEVIPESVGQFTGLLDKTGVQIFEGDIVEHNDNRFICGYSFQFGFVYVAINKNLGNYISDFILTKSHNNRKQIDIYGIQKYIEVIGNIHENSEVIKS